MLVKKRLSAQSSTKKVFWLHEDSSFGYFPEDQLKMVKENRLFLSWAETVNGIKQIKQKNKNNELIFQMMSSACIEG